jgi:arylsulfatase A-like enzyme
MFVIDSLRADHCSTYGYHRSTTPIAATLASRGVLFTNHFSAYIPTTPAYSTILTGRDVMAHETVALQPKGPFDPAIRLLPEALKEAGYTCIRVGLHGDLYRGFDRLDGYSEGWYRWEDRPARKAESMNEVAIPALEELAAGKSPWLLFLRHMDPHAPYLPPPPFDTMFYSKDPADPGIPDTMGPVRDFPNFRDFHLAWMPPGVRDIQHPISQYDGAIAYMDTCIQRILSRLEELGQAENTLIVWTSDHGETLDEHGCYFDHHGLYEPTLRVPLILSHPGKLPEGKVVDAITLHQDLMPTVLEHAGLAESIPALGMEGQSVLPLISGEVPALRSEFYITECTWMRKRGWRTPEWKFIEALEPDFHGKPQVELYNLKTDPLELTNAAEKAPDVVALLKERMEGWIAQRLKETGKPDPIMGYSLGVEGRIGAPPSRRSRSRWWRLRNRGTRALSGLLSNGLRLSRQDAPKAQP